MTPEQNSSQNFKTIHWTKKLLGSLKISSFSAPELVSAITDNNYQGVKEIVRSYFRPSYENLATAYQDNIIILAGTTNSEILTEILKAYHKEISLIDKASACQFFIEHQQFANLTLVQSDGQKIADNQIVKIMSYLHQIKIDHSIYQRFYQITLTYPTHINFLEKCFTTLMMAHLSEDFYQKYFEHLIANIQNIKYLQQCFSLLIQSDLIGVKNQALYERLIHTQNNIKPLAKCLLLLEQADLSGPSNQDLYYKLVHTTENTLVHVKYFSLLIQKKMTGNVYKGFYEYSLENDSNAQYFFNTLNESLIQKSSHTEQLANCFSILVQINLKENNVKIYDTLLKNYTLSVFVYSSFNTIKKNNLTGKEHHSLYQKIIDHAYNADAISQGLFLLSQLNFTPLTYYKLSKNFIHNSFGSAILLKGLLLLSQSSLKGDIYEPLYENIIKNKNNALDIAQGFILLSQNNLSPIKHPVCYETISKRGNHAKSLAMCLILLSQADITETDSVSIYQALIHKARSSDFIRKGFKVLIKNNLTGKNHEQLYSFVIQKPYNAQFLAQCFASLTKNNLTIELYPDLYSAVVKKEQSSLSLSKCFALLYQANLDGPTHRELYWMLTQRKHSFEFLAKSFILLSKENLTLRDHPELYDILFNKNTGTGLEFLARNFVSLAKTQLFYHTNPEFYLSLCHNPTLNNISRIALDEVLSLMANMQIFYTEENKGYFSDCFLLTHNELSKQALETLKNSGYTLQNHKKIIHKILYPMTIEAPNRIALINTLSYLINYANENELLNINDEGYISQINIIEEMTEIQEINLTEGPLNKNAATYEVERILRAIVTYDIVDVQIHFDELEHYILHMPNQPEVNLTMLLNNANLTHLYLKNESKTNNIIELLDSTINKLISDWDTFSSDNPIVNLLPLPQQKAITIYTHFQKNYYININKFLRGEALDHKENQIFNTQDFKNNYLICFIIGCLVSDAINKLPCLVTQIINNEHSQVNISEYLAPRNALLDRGEHLTDEIVKKRLANPWSFPALTSFSSTLEGHSTFHKNGATRTKLENPPSIMPIINIQEKEILFVHGTQILTTQWDKGLLNRVVNSPLLEKPNHYWSDSALTYSFKHYLSKNYQDERSEIVLEGKKIVRPNHNLTHVFRTINAIPLVIDYFKKHANDLNFKEFCASISQENIEWLKVAAAFSVTGRESEVSFIHNPDLYNKYRCASAKHFKSFVNKTKDLKNPYYKAMTMRFYNIIKYLSNPFYEKENKNNKPINCISDQTERDLRNYYFRILTTARKLDLARCYNAQKYKQEIEYVNNLSTKNSFQENDLCSIIFYNIELIKIQGNSLLSDIKPDGTLIDTNLDYRPIFAETSASITRLDELTQSVTLPKLIQYSSKLNR